MKRIIILLFIIQAISEFKNNSYNIRPNIRTDPSFRPIYLLYGDISYENINVIQFVKTISKLNKYPNSQTILLHISSNGGEVSVGLELYEIMKLSKNPIETFVAKNAFSVGSLLFCAGEKRHMRNNSFLLIHNPYFYITKSKISYEELKKEYKNIKEQMKKIREIYFDCSYLTKKKIKIMMKNNTLLTSDDALFYGFAHDIY